MVRGVVVSLNDASHCSDDDVRSYTVTKLKTICSTSEEQFKWFKKLHSILAESDVYVPIEMRKYVTCTKIWEFRWLLSKL